MTTNSLSIVKKLLEFSPREGKNETKTGKFLTGLLAKNKVDYKLQKFTFYIPKDLSAQLIADGKNIPCEPITFKSGVIPNKNHLISNRIEVEKNFPYISFTPTGVAISASGRSIHYPALAVSRNDVVKILRAKLVRGKVQVKPVQHQSQNILVGNLTNPKKIIFTHYDSINLGATDNASGVATCLKLILDKPNLLKQNLFVLSGNEELSYEFPTYWGYGYRVFEKKYLALLKIAR